ncbi:hypothetical protein GCM10010393_01460 [Streptomyces gobitricini]|uniref:Uncharacterized protein n=1 Tax=Streptomyces gobitricini TaxID=68211 RepID=A0ABP5Y8R8_9ACTN
MFIALEYPPNRGETGALPGPDGLACTLIQSLGVMIAGVRTDEVAQVRPPLIDTPRVASG